VTAATRLPPLTVVVGLIAAFLTGSLPSQATAESLSAAPSAEILPVVAYAPFVTEASRRFTIPEQWIRTVMKAESGGNAQAVSSRGALGLMQIMPATWVELSVRNDLGVDPFDPRDNILAGTAYLREMLDRFGSEGFLAAYNAGPRRYEQLLATGRRLPEETLIYVRTIQSEIGSERGQSGVPLTVPTASRLQDVPSAEPSMSSSVGSRSTTIAQQIGRSREMPNADVSALIPHATGLFVQSSSVGSSR
jgi:hypothetical protein